MGKNILVISADLRETRVALIEDGIIAELHIERGSQVKGGKASTVGDVVLGKVTRVLPGLQAAFIDVGQERAAFLHVEDLIRPDDFEGYLAGGKKQATRDDGEAVPGATGNIELDEEAEAEIEIQQATEPPAAEGAANDTTAPEAEEDDDASAEDAAASGAEIDEEDDEEEDAEDEAAEAIAHGEPVDDEGEEASWDEPESPAPAAAGEASPDAIAREVAARARSTHSIHTPASDELETPLAAQVAVPAAAKDDAGARFASEAPTSVASFEATTPTAPAVAARGKRPPARDALDDFPDMPGFTISDVNDPMPRAPAAPRSGPGGDRQGGRGRRGRGRGRDGQRRSGGAGGGGGTGAGGGTGGGGGGGGGENHDRGGGRGKSGGNRGRGNREPMPGRISKSTPIREVVKEGQEIIVQISKDPIGTKGARCTSHVSLAGRYVVYLPTVDHIGISKRIGSDRERARLRETIESIKPKQGGLIVRTVAEGLTKKGLKQDIGYLVRLWGEIATKREDARAPSMLSSELDLVLKTARDLFTDEVDEIVIDDRHQYDRLLSFVEMFAPDRLKDITYYSGEEAIFDAYGIEDEIGRALSRKVPLPSGGALVIDQAEALTAIDVNTGRFVGKGSKDLEDTILKTNLEAVHEIAYQLRFRNIGGLIILDLIDMEKASNREKVRRTLEELLQKDKAKTTLNRISELGLIEMTRKRTRESLGRLMHEPCFYCDGTGQLQSKETIAYEIMREIRRRKADLPGYTIVVNAHPAVIDLLSNGEKAAVADVENKYMRKVTLVPRKEYHYEQFDLEGK
ncbi:MAG: Rne/Rng family ribonuclease [Polyangiaceae bacterium]